MSEVRYNQINNSYFVVRNGKIVAKNLTQKAAYNIAVHPIKQPSEYSLVRWVLCCFSILSIVSMLLGVILI